MTRVHGRPNGRQSKHLQTFPRYILLAGLFLVLLSVLLWASLGSPESTVADTGIPVEVNRPAPNFVLKSPQGKDISLSEYEGEVLVLNFWATWCPPCRAEMPDIHAVYQSHKNEGLAVLAVNAQEESSLVSDFVMQFGLTFPVVLDTNGVVMARYKVYGLPTTFIIDRDGIVRHIQSGPITSAQLETIVADLL